jgi:hypothetical protein
MSYDPELAVRFCAALADGKRSIRAICAQKGMPSKATIFRWLRDVPEFLTMYEQAKDEQADTFVDEVVSIADECKPDADSIKKAKLRIYARIEAAQKMKPKKYGQKLQLAGDGGGPIQAVTRVELVPMQKNDSSQD